MLYHCIVKCGHVGTGHFVEKSVYVHAKSVMHAFTLAKGLRGVKKGHLYRNGSSVLAVCKVRPTLLLSRRALKQRVLQEA
ncbi:MAG: hypothetical protein K1X53_01485 [Candidatus Sumerlaeaceae bacterium]|nr:hypothetical protein [Candidatus Sumerlaeaceae bacterium]